MTVDDLSFYLQAVLRNRIERELSGGSVRGVGGGYGIFRGLVDSISLWMLGLYIMVYVIWLCKNCIICEFLEGFQTGFRN